MRFNSVGDAVTGFSTIAVNGVTPPNLVGIWAGNPLGPSFFTDDEIFFQYQASPTSYRLGLYDLGTDVLTQVSAQGANVCLASSGIWAAFLVGSGVRTNVSGFGPLAAASLQDANGGRTVILDNYQSGSGVRVYTATGASLYAVGVTLVYTPCVLRGDLLAYNNASGWFLSNVATGAGLSYLRRTDGVNWVIPIDVGGTPWVVERTNRLYVRESLATVAYDLTALFPIDQQFNPDALVISAGVLRLGACANQGESPTSLRVVDLTLATGATLLASTSGGALSSFSAGPTLVPSSVPTGSTSVGGGSGGGTPIAGGSTTNAIRYVTRPALPHAAARKTYPHVAEISIADAVVDEKAPVPRAVRNALAASQQSTRLLWDVYGTLVQGREADQATVTAQAATIARLQSQLLSVRATAYEALTAAGKPTLRPVSQPGGPQPPNDPVGGPPIITPPVVPPGTADAIDANAITWVGLNVSAWPITAAITSVQITSTQICLDYTGKNAWPAVDPDGSGTLSPGNPWIIAEIAGTKYASTYEWLRVGQTCKNVTGPEFQDYVTGTSPLDTWTPALGETVWFMVSALARNGPQSPVNQRTQIVAVTWPF